MVSNEAHQKAAQNISDSLERIKRSIPELTGVVDAFADLLIAKSTVKLQIAMPGFSNIEIDPLRFSQGAPVLNDRRIEVEKESVQKVAMSLMPAIKRGFPKMASGVESLVASMNNDETVVDKLLLVLESGSSDSINDTALKLKISAEALKLVCSELAKPFAEKVAEIVGPMIQGLAWSKGYCPVCGSWPSVSVWKGDEGRRFLNCSVCGHEWNYIRSQCPFCENTDQNKMELIFSEDRKFEHAELCHVCKKYIVGIDARNLINPPHPSTAPISLIYLDVLAQDRGFTPGATFTMFSDLTL
ncbi:MAG: formate dehydrogenase accessory protein FdhE [Desulfomonilaceae bacterium]